MGLPTGIDPNKKSYELYEGVDYKEFWRFNDQRSMLDLLERHLIQTLLPIAGKRIIDLGCGYGRLINCYSDRFEQVVMFDSSISLLQQAQEKSKSNTWFVAGDINHLPFRKASFENVLMIRVFHHIPDSRHCLSEISRILQGSGNLIFSYSNKRNLARMTAYLMRRDKVNPFSLQPSGLGTTLIRHHPKFVRALLNEENFSKIKSLGVGVFDKLNVNSTFSNLIFLLSRAFAPLMGRLSLAPWMIINSETVMGSQLIDAHEIIDLLQCPSCCGYLVDTQDNLCCKKCNERYPILNGIIDMRPR